MKKSIEEKRARLRAKADKVIDEYIVWEASHPKPDLKQIDGVDPVRWTMVCLVGRRKKCQEVIYPILRNFAISWLSW
jgi:hypothetical protein